MARRKPPRFFLSRIFFFLASVTLSASLLFLFLMLSAETQALRKARSADIAAIRSLGSLMTSRNPERVPDRMKSLSKMTGIHIVILDPEGKPAWRNTLLLRKIQSFTRVPDDWLKAPHGPFVFSWPPPGVPPDLAQEISRMAARKGDHHLLTDRQGIPTPLQPKGGIAVWSLPIPNAPSCAQCHGFDSEILGTAVSFVPVPPFFPDNRHHSLWGFWPLPELNQKIILVTASGLTGVLFLTLILVDEWQIRRKWMKADLKNSSSKGKSGASLERPVPPRPGHTAEQGESLSLAPEDVPDLFHRLSFLDRELETELALLPHAGIQPPTEKPPGENLKDAIDRMASWTDSVELLLMDLGALAATRTDPLLKKAVDALSRLKDQALEMNRILEEEVAGTTRSAPPYNTLNEEEKKWVEDLRAGLQRIHAELRAIGGMVHKSSFSPSTHPPEKH